VEEQQMKQQRDTLIIATIKKHGHVAIKVEFKNISVKQIHEACVSKKGAHMGQCHKTTYEDGNIHWNFKKGYVFLTGDVKHKFGYRTI
jgi:hypothetical protein